MWWYDIPLHGSVLLAPLGVLALIGLGTMIGVLLTPLGVLYQDVSRGLIFATQALFFLTPVIYPVPQAAFAAPLIELNPVTPLLVSTLVLLFAGWVLYRIAMPHLISRMSA